MPVENDITVKLTARRSDSLGRASEAAADFATRLGRAYVEAVGPTLLELGRRLHAASWKAYRTAGAPYGETGDGLSRWLCERAKVDELRAEADRIESLHESCAALRRQSTH